jgi:hypothetical protein
MEKKIKNWSWLLLGFSVASLISFAPVSITAQTPRTEVNISTGNESGEYYAIAKDIERLAAEKGIDVDVFPTRGALQNIVDVYEHESVPLGISQTDVLAFLNLFANNDEDIRRQAEALRSVLPLYEEYVHLIARKDIKTLTDLNGKRISIGESGSGTSLTASNILFLGGIKPAELQTMEIRRGIDALRKGEIDAVFYVVGAPAAVLEKEIVAEDNFHLVNELIFWSDEDEFYKQLYPSVDLPAKTYSWQIESVRSIAVRSVLFTTDTQECSQIEPLVKLVYENLSWLQENGEPIWKKVTFKLSENQNKTRISPCVAKYFE